MAQAVAAVGVVEAVAELIEQVERWFAHQVEHVGLGVLGRHFQAAADVVGDEFVDIFAVGGVDFSGA